MRLLVLMLLVLASIFGVGLIMSNDDSSMPGCPFMGERAGFCQMNLLEHINKWNLLFIFNLITLLGVSSILYVSYLSTINDPFLYLREKNKRLNFVFQLSIIEILQL